MKASLYLLHAVAFPPVAVVGSLPIGDLRSVGPDNASGMETPGDANGLGPWLVQGKGDGGQTRGETAAINQGLAQEGTPVQPVYRSSGETGVGGKACFAFMSPSDHKRGLTSSVSEWPIKDTRLQGNKIAFHRIPSANCREWSGFDDRLRRYDRR